MENKTKLQCRCYCGRHKKWVFEKLFSYSLDKRKNCPGIQEAWTSPGQRCCLRDKRKALASALADLGVTPNPHGLLLIWVLWSCWTPRMFFCISASQTCRFWFRRSGWSLRPRIPMTSQVIRTLLARGVHFE